VQTEQDEEVVEDEVVGKILLLTILYSNEIEYNAHYVYAQTAAERYPDRVVHFYSKQFYLEGEHYDSWIEDLIEEIDTRIRNDQIKAFIVINEYNEYNDVVVRVSELHPELFFFGINALAFVNEKIDKHMSLDYRCPEYVIKNVQQAKLMGVENIVSFMLENPSTGELYTDGYLSIVREESNAHGITYSERSTALYNSYQPFFEAEINEKGRNTMFYTNFAYSGLGRDTLVSGAVTIPVFSPDMTSILFSIGYINYGDYDSQQEVLREFLKEHNATGNSALWYFPLEHIALTAAVEYAIGYIDGDIEACNDYDALFVCFGKGFQLLGNPEIGFELHRSETYDNLFFLVQDYMVY